jgi:hypothetical protein
VPECSRRHKCFAERVFPGGVVSNENENGSNGKSPALSSVCKASTSCPHVYMRPQKRPLRVLMFRRLCFRVRLLARFASLYFMSESH